MWEVQSDPIILRYLLPDRAVYNQRQCCHTPNHPQMCFLWNFAHEEGNRSVGEKEKESKKKKSILVSPDPLLLNFRPNQCSSQPSPCSTLSHRRSRAAAAGPTAALAMENQTFPGCRNYYAPASFSNSCSCAHPGPPAGSLTTLEGFGPGCSLLQLWLEREAGFRANAQPQEEA